MLTQDQAEKLAVEYRTVTDNILKEHYQMYILDTLFTSSFERELVFKGGTALRLAYGSFRFSEDLDFSLLKSIPYASFKSTIEKLSSIMPEVKVKDIYDKRNTFFAKIVFDVGFKPIPIGIKVEINKNVGDFASTVGLLRSPFNNIEVSGNVYTIEAILKDKVKILETKERREPRDLFDAWYIHQKLHTAFAIKQEFKYTQKQLMDRLNPFIPINHRKVLEEFAL
ncbi:MAG: nucleotidyl transferase AbiEii/AbiGii toxin family protein [Patescibacteria group bacterium]